jgi:hypothetical protein
MEFMNNKNQIIFLYSTHKTYIMLQNLFLSKIYTFKTISFHKAHPREQCFP